MALFEQFPYLNFHEMNQSWLLDTVKKLSENYENLDADALERQLQNYIDEQMSLLGELKHEHVYNAIEKYVDCVDGSNVSGDGTVAHPYYTIAKALEYMDKNCAGMVIKLAHGGTYTINKAQISGCYLRIEALVTGVTIAWLDGSSTKTHMLNNSTLYIVGYNDGTTTFTPMGSGDTVCTGATLLCEDCHVTGGTDTVLRISTGYAAFAGCLMDIAVVGNAANITLEDCGFAETQRTTARPCLSVWAGSTLSLNQGCTFTAATITPVKTSYYIEMDNSLLFMDGNVAASPVASIRKFNVSNSMLFIPNVVNADRWFVSTSVMTEFTLNGIHYPTLPGLFSLTGSMEAISGSSLYNSYFDLYGYELIAIKGSMTNADGSANFYTEFRPEASNNYHPVIGLAGNTLYRLNIQCNASRQIRVVSCTAYDLTAGAYTTTQNADVAFTFYVIPGRAMIT